MGHSSYYNGSTSPDGGNSAELTHVTSITPVPTQSSSDGDIKTEDGQEINCVVCGDKSSGKHYGQFTCEGKVSKIAPLNFHPRARSALRV